MFDSFEMSASRISPGSVLQGTRGAKHPIPELVAGPAPTMTTSAPAGRGAGAPLADDRDRDDQLDDRALRYPLGQQLLKPLRTARQGLLGRRGVPGVGVGGAPG